MRVLCFLALGRPNLEDHWNYPTQRPSRTGADADMLSKASVLLAISGVFVSTASLVSYFDYTSPVPYCLLFISLMLAMLAMLTSGSSMIRWLHTDQHWTQEQLRPGGYFVLSYLLSIVTPIFFVVWSLNCFIFAMLIAGFSSRDMICRAVTAIWMVIYVVNVGTMLMEGIWKYATSLNHAGRRQ
ncbi:uncharacterized protein EDB93DRAFT_1137690 [Suillus bovinus]|uniref:uncharacterized protein n=1 Tax=Suillus bovinus TaxID=48563 RepID=UPI001B87497D|nr:uncharacterized protein EDB93DRAFT_1137690 [Suillus bovinus]KAG2152630.1 hypothetical protein EDB93DRAFT_1137690 [Suillus bovinus]